jgi:hypothetical protein
MNKKSEGGQINTDERRFYIRKRPKDKRLKGTWIILNVAKTSREQIRHSRESGNPAREPGFRVKPGMTEAKGLRK